MRKTQGNSVAKKFLVSENIFQLSENEIAGGPMEQVVSGEDILKAEESQMVCYCSKVTKGDILKAIGDGANTLEEIKISTGACTIGRCKDLSPRKR